jgi:hypothetical protein
VERLLIFIKHHLAFLWKIIEWINNLLFSITYARSMFRISDEVIAVNTLNPYTFRILGISDAEALFELIKSQNPHDLKYFNPHSFDLDTIRKHLNKQSFLMMGALDGNKIVGYFFLRFFANKKCFVGRIIDKEYRGKGIGPVMNEIMYQTSWGMGFRCLSTISKNNRAVMNAHSKNRSMVILKELHNDYLLVEFIRN